MGMWYNQSFNESICPKLPPLTTGRYVRDTDILLSLSYSKSPSLRQFWTTHYVRDLANFMTHVEFDRAKRPPQDVFALLRIGDSASSSTVLPVMAKARNLRSHKTIIFPSNMNSLFRDQLGKLQQLVQDSRDTPWAEKKEAVVWRGSCTGVRYDTSVPNTRVAFVHRWHNATKDKIDVALASPCDRLPQPWRTRYQHNSWVQNKMSMNETLSYKYLLSLEGNDVATNLKWLLASSSVVFMPVPTASAWLMEDILVPYVHYIPVALDGSDLLEKLEWAQANDDKCQWISQQATKYMDDMWLSPQAQADHAAIRLGMAQRYYEQFGHAMGECVAKNTKM